MNPSRLQTWAALAGRLLYSLIFVVGGLEHFRDLDGMTLMAVEHGVPLPRVSVLVSGGLFVAGGLLVLFGWRSRVGAAVLVLTLVPVTYWMHRPATDPGQIVQILKNCALLGGGLFLVAHGPGALSLDGALRPSPDENEL